MVVIVLVQDPRGRNLPRFPQKRVTYSSRIFIKPTFSSSQVEPGDTFATTKEEEWISKKKTEVLNTKQIETRVKRQVVLEDGKVVEDSGPMVTTNTTEDTETQEHHQTELRKLGDDDVDGPRALGDEGVLVDKSNWTAVPNPDGVVREVKERKIVSREETEEVKETEDVQHLGDITDEEFLAAVRSGKRDLRSVLRSSEAGRAVVSTGPRVIRDTSKSKKVTDTEDTRELSSVLPGGKIVTETQRTTEHEEVDDDELPEDALEQDYHKETSQRYLKTREQEDVDYLANGRSVGHEMKYKTETMEIDKRGEDEVDLFESLSTRARRRGNRQPHRYRGVSEWSERRQDKQHHYNSQRESPLAYQHSPPRHVPSPYYVDRPSKSPIPDYMRSRRSPSPDYRPQYSPLPDYRNGHSPSPDYSRPVKISASPIRDQEESPTPPQRKKAVDRREKYADSSDRRIRYDSGYRSTGRVEDLRDDRIDRIEEPPPDYSPPSPPPMPREDKKHYQKTRFATDTTPPKTKSGNIIGQSIRKLVNKIRSASAERKAKQQRARRSPSPSYQPGHVIDNIGHTMERQPVQRYYLGEDPFGGSIYGRENKYDGVKPARSSRKGRDDDRDRRSQSTLGRFSKSTSRLMSRSVDEGRSSQTLPRHLNKYELPNRLNGNNRSNSTINVSIINTVTPPRIVNEGPAKPARTYKSNLARSKSLIVHGDLDATQTRPTMYTSNSNIHRLNDNPSGLKSPGLISSLNRSHKDVNNDDIYTSRFQRNGDSVDSGIRRYPDFSTNKSENKRVYISDIKSSSPDYFKTINGDSDDWRTRSYNTATSRSTTRNFNGTDVYEPPTRLRDTHITTSAPSPSHSILRRGSNSSTDFSETYHTTTRNDDPQRPSVTNTVKTISKKTIPGRHGRGLETIESSEVKSITKSHYRNSSRGGSPPGGMRYYESERRYDTSKPVVIEVRNYKN
ncbi:serine/arginine repetitive matrix protein 1 isoform X3 [Euwallacea fornicatus]|uniref:serine/arginine repetitive matrix protein 1 isoform X3 n=1 Tax=Euwallacea fornicatus TaxID=995702 RepID=UPI00338FD8BE